MINHFQDSHCSHCSFKCQSFKLLTEDEINIINQHRFDTIYKKGEIIVKAGTPASNIIVLSSGLSKLIWESNSVSEKKDTILEILKPVKVIASEGIFSDNKHHFSIVAISECKACLIETEVFKQVLFENQAFSRMFFSEMSLQSIRLYKKFSNLLNKQMHGRIAEALIYLSRKIFESKNFDMILSRQELAAMTGMTKESVCRILKEFKDEGIVYVNKNHIEIRKDESLEIIARRG